LGLSDSAGWVLEGAVALGRVESSDWSWLEESSRSLFGLASDSDCADGTDMFDSSSVFVGEFDRRGDCGVVAEEDCGYKSYGQRSSVVSDGKRLKIDNLPSS
jgi:hypothetical protein